MTTLAQQAQRQAYTAGEGGRCRRGAQERVLQEGLASAPEPCALAFWHFPHWSSHWKMGIETSVTLLPHSFHCATSLPTAPSRADCHTQCDPAEAVLHEPHPARAGLFPMMLRSPESPLSKAGYYSITRMDRDFLWPAGVQGRTQALQNVEVTHGGS